MDNFLNLIIKLKQRFSQRDIFILSILLSLILVYLIYVFFLSYSFSALNSKRQEITNLEASYRELLKLTEIKDKIRQDIIFTQKQTEEANRYIPTEAELTKVLFAITKYAEARNINIVSINADLTAQEKSFAFEKNNEAHVLDKLKVKKVKLQIEGDYRQIIYFLYDLANTERAYIVRELTLESLEKKDNIKADVEILIFYTKDAPTLVPLLQQIDSLR